MIELLIDRMKSPVGELVLVSDGEALRALEFAEHEQRMHRLLRLRHGEYTLTAAPNPAGVCGEIAAYFEGEFAALDRVRVRTGGSPFQRGVWTALRRIAPGTTITYGELAARIGRPSAVRAAGAANGSNPIVIVVPCHRVIGAGGALTGYGGGLERKRWLLAHERARCAATAPILSAV